MVQSIRFPSVTEEAVTSPDELLAFATLPYYQVSKALKDAEGAVAIGDPIAWDTSVHKFIKFDPGATQVTDEAVGTGDGSDRVWELARGFIQPGSYTIKVDGVAQVEGDDYALDLRTGYLVFVTAPAAVAITATYKYYANMEADKAKAVGFVRIPGDSTDGDVPIEAVIGGAVKWNLVSGKAAWDAKIFEDLYAVKHLAGNALIF